MSDLAALTHECLLPGAPSVLDFYWVVVGGLPTGLIWGRKMVKAGRPVSQQRVGRAALII